MGVRNISLVLLFIGFVSNASAQFGDYYNGISESLRCSALKTALHNLIKKDSAYILYNVVNEKFYVGSPGSTSADIRKSDDGLRIIMWDIYSDNPNGADPYEFLQSQKICGSGGLSATTEGVCWNKEHLVAASWFGGANQYPMYSDLLILTPTDGFVNGKRGNLPHGKVNSPNSTTLNGGKFGPNASAGYSGNVFEPIDAYKGDVARAYFYFVTRYENRLSTFTTPEAKVVFTNDTYPALQNWILQLMLQWHKADPPSQKEINENAIAFVNQKNRNPFIDRPEYVTRIWGTDGTNCATATGIAQKTVQTLNIFPNPANGQIQVVSNAKAGYLQYNLLDISGKTISTGTTLQSGTNAAITLPALSKGMYFLQMTDADGEIFAGSLISM